MPQQRYILSIDQGTTSSRAIVFSRDGQILTVAQQEFPQIYPESGHVEHDPEQIWSSTLTVCREVMQKAAGLDGEIVGIGITNQRETTVIWDRQTGKPIYNAIVWQDRRTAGFCQRLKAAGHEAEATERTGLLIDPYFSGTKVAWILDHVDGARRRAENGELAFGTIDTFLLWRLTGGRVHATDATNASRTLLYNIQTRDWDARMLEILNIPKALLPEIRDCAADFGICDAELLGRALPIAGIAGDQQAATVGQACLRKGMIKSTYGTGCFVVLNTGDEPLRSQHRLLTTVGYQLEGKPTYALEGSIFVAGAAVQWLRDGLGVINHARDTQPLAEGLASNKGVYLVPAFTGLGAPHWNPDVRGALFGLTRDTGPAELARAALEAVCYQTHDLFRAMAEDGLRPQSLRVDGGMVINNWLTQFLADILGVSVERPEQIETTALGAAMLAALQLGLFDSLDEMADAWRLETRFEPSMDASLREQLLTGWDSAVASLCSR